MFLQPLHIHNHIYMHLQDKEDNVLTTITHTHNHIYMKLQDKEDNVLTTITHTHNHIYMHLQDKEDNVLTTITHTHNHIYMHLQDKEDNVLATITHTQPHIHACSVLWGLLCSQSGLRPDSRQRALLHSIYNTNIRGSLHWWHYLFINHFEFSKG